MKARKSPSGRRSLAVAKLRARRSQAKQRSQEARQKARDAKAQAKAARRLSKEAKKVAREAKAALQSIERKLKKLMSSAAKPKSTPAARKKSTRVRQASLARKASAGTNDATGPDDQRVRRKKRVPLASTEPERGQAEQPVADNTASDGSSESSESQTGQ